TAGQLAYVANNNTLVSVGTSTATCSSGVSCNTFTVVGSTNPSFTLDVTHPNIWTGLQTFNANASSTGLSANYLSVGGTATTTLTAAGNLGVGTTTPNNKLDVNGNGYLSGT